MFIAFKIYNTNRVDTNKLRIFTDDGCKLQFSNKPWHSLIEKLKK